jgi:hypothetical protein
MNLASLSEQPERIVSADKPIGEIIAVSGSKATVLLNEVTATASDDEDSCPLIGTLLSVDTDLAVVLCQTTAMRANDEATEQAYKGKRVVEVELVGELPREKDGYLKTFRRGVSRYPRLGDKVMPPSHTILEKAYHFGNFDAIEIGALRQDLSIPAVLKVDDMLSKHFAIVGSTGTGKSCTVALVLRQVLLRHPSAHIVLLDPHNEYGACFNGFVELVDLKTLCLPFWLLTFEEAVEILIGDAHNNPDEVDILRDLIPVAKRQFASNGSRATTLLRKSAGGPGGRYSVDVPVPYRMSDLLALIDEQMGRLEMKKELRPFRRLKARIELIKQDPRYSFMFGNMTIQDDLPAVLRRLFRIPVNGKPISVIQLLGLPGEIVNVIVSVLARLAFDLAIWSEGKVPMTFVCEEAHRYVPRDSATGFEPAKRALSRIAKEGRKYGLSLCIVSQRPGDVDPAIFSQCSTILTMRLSNDMDQSIIRSALSECSAGLLAFVPSLGERETIIFGEGVPLPSRIILSELPSEVLPRGDTASFSTAWSSEMPDDGFVEDVVARWRSIGQLADEDPFPSSGDPVAEAAPASNGGGAYSGHAVAESARSADEFDALLSRIRKPAPEVSSQ